MQTCFESPFLDPLELVVRGSRRQCAADRIFEYPGLQELPTGIRRKDQLPFVCKHTIKSWEVFVLTDPCAFAHPSTSSPFWPDKKQHFWSAIARG